MKLFVSFILQNVYQSVPDLIENTVMETAYPPESLERIRGIEDHIRIVQAQKAFMKLENYPYQRCRILQFQVIEAD